MNPRHSYDFSPTLPVEVREAAPEYRDAYTILKDASVENLTAWKDGRDKVTILELLPSGALSCEFDDHFRVTVSPHNLSIAGMSLLDWAQEVQATRQELTDTIR